MITKFEVKNFKKFDHLVVENLGQVNLITGDNNVGKSCLLEALVLKNDIKENMAYLDHILASRGFEYDDDYKHNITEVEFNHKNNIVGLFQKKIDEPIITIKTQGDKSDKISIFNVNAKIIDSVDSEILTFINKIKRYPGINLLSKNWILFYVDNSLEYVVDVTSEYYNQFLNSAEYLSLITLDDFFREDIVDLFTEVINNVDIKNRFSEILNTIFQESKIIDIQPTSFHGRKQLSIATEINKNYKSITYYGGGFIRTFRIVLELFLNKDGQLMIDEIDTGIHHSRMKKEWEVILQLAKELNVQIFATTHSFDCINSFAEATNNDTYRNDVRLIELKEATVNNINKIYSTTYNSSQIETALTSNTNIRGGQIHGKY